MSESNELQTITEIDLDINQPSLAIVHAKQYDTVRKVKCNLFYNGVKWFVPSTNIEAVVSYKKGSNGGFYDETQDGETAVSISSNDRSIIYIILDRNVVTVDGEVNVELTFYDMHHGRLSSFKFMVLVEPATINELDLVANPGFKILAESISRVLQAEQHITGLTVSLAEQQPAAGASPTVSISGGTGEDHYNIAFGIPAGPTGSPPTPSGNATYEYAVSTSGTTIPSSFSSGTAPQRGRYYWTKITTPWNTGNTVHYSVTYIGENGSGAVHSVNGLASDVILTADLINLSYANVSVEDALDALTKNTLYFTDVPCQATTGDFVTLIDSDITSDYVVTECTFVDPIFIRTDVTWTTTNGSLTLNGRCASITSADIVLSKKGN